MWSRAWSRRRLGSCRLAHNDGKHKIDFSLRGVPVVSRFVARDAEMRELERLLIRDGPATRRRNVVVIHGLGGIGKTQLAVEFARKHQHSFSGSFWLDGSSDTSLKQSFADMVQRLPRDELAATGTETAIGHANADADAAVHECLRWLSLSSNRRWLLIVDNVDRDHNDAEDSQAYNVKEYFPHADHGSVLITSRLAGLQRHGAGVRVGTVAAEQARAILESNAGREVKDADAILKLLNGLPLALTQAGSYMRETNVSASAYIKHYNATWKQLMKKQGRFPPEEYGDRSVLTTWTMSYEQARRQSEEAACLLKLWGFLDSGEMWYELVAAGSGLAEEMEVPGWLAKMAGDELEFGEAAGLLLRYSLVEAVKDRDSYSMHSVLHRWCGQLAEGEERHELCRTAAGLVACSVPSESEADFWEKRKRILSHGMVISGWIESKKL
ncbi:hypothetical protein BS50DRAFT_538593 [Corynespora cassiicola Philippines]|uniref:Orc1-like AAA ATPase domain-containing protein n=1 Tax=Corynespora cassiicola Philippines TaxID=1448308 RepID=A0A2T2MZK3_CORCC|nr:hypothetical protein BS50DRAFT_538593 [Corynespora cassiicola Philippines]